MTLLTSLASGTDAPEPAAFGWMPATAAVAAVALSALLLAKTLPKAEPHRPDPRDIEIGAATLVGFLLVAIAGALVLDVSSGAKGGATAPFPQLGPLGPQLVAFLGNVIVIAIAAGVARLRRAPLSRALGIERAPSVWDLALAFRALLAIAPAFVGISYLETSLHRGGGEPEQQELVETLIEHRALLAEGATIALIGIVGPLLEEVMFRALILRALLSAVRPVFAVLLSALAFALVHDRSQPQVFVLGVMLGLLFQRTASLWPGFFAHAAFNLLMLVVIIPLQAGGG